MKRKRPARILEISSYPPPRAGWGVRISFVREHLEAAGHECQVLNIGRSRRVRSPEYLDVQNGLDYLRKALRYARNGYLVHTHLNGDSPKGLILAIVAELVSLATGCRCVLTFHAGPRQRFFPADQNRVLAPFFALAFAIPKAIICNSEAVARVIQGYGVPPARIRPIPAFSRQYLRYAPTPLPADLEEFLRRHRPVLASYFFFRPEFFVPSLVSAIPPLASALPEMGVVFIGGDSRSEPVSELIERAGVAERVYQAGDLGHDEFMTLLSRTHLFVRTPEKDGVCSSVLEALSLGVPVVASENGARPRGVVTFRAGDTADLVAKVLAVWARYESIRSQLEPPKVEDTVAEEAALLVELAS